jgi:hypothetical protein
LATLWQRRAGQRQALKAFDDLCGQGRRRRLGKRIHAFDDRACFFSVAKTAKDEPEGSEARHGIWRLDLAQADKAFGERACSFSVASTVKDEREGSEARLEIWMLWPLNLLAQADDAFGERARLRIACLAAAHQGLDEKVESLRHRQRFRPVSCLESGEPLACNGLGVPIATCGDQVLDATQCLPELCPLPNAGTVTWGSSLGTGREAREREG